MGGEGITIIGTVLTTAGTTPITRGILT
jgi:hypothetical protein